MCLSSAVVSCCRELFGGVDLRCATLAANTLWLCGVVAAAVQSCRRHSRRHQLTGERDHKRSLCFLFSRRHDRRSAAAAAAGLKLKLCALSLQAWLNGIEAINDWLATQACRWRARPLVLCVCAELRGVLFVCTHTHTHTHKNTAHTIRLRCAWICV